MVHGLGSRSSLGPLDYFYGLHAILREAKIPFLVAKLSLWHSIEFRAKQLKAQIEKAFPAGKVNLIGHSMGGLDSRYVTSQLDFGERIASVTSIGTPHRGTLMGDIATAVIGQKNLTATNRFLHHLGLSNDGLKQLTTQYNAEVWSSQMPDVPGVAYFSATSAIPKTFVQHSLPIFWGPYHLLRKLEGDNDGFVSVHSATWGTHICTYRGDHYAQIGQFMGHTRGLDYLKFYREILDRLHREAM